MCLNWWVHVWERCSFILTLPAHALEGQSRWRLPSARRNVLSFSLSSTAKGTQALFWSPEHQSMDSELPSTLRPALLHVRTLYTPLVGPSNSWECESRGLLMPGTRKYRKCTWSSLKKVNFISLLRFFPPLKGAHQCFSLIFIFNICAVATNNILTQTSIKSELLMNGFCSFFS